MQNQGERYLLIRLLERKFGTLPKEIQENFYLLDTEAILDCIERLATAQCIEELLPKASPFKKNEIFSQASFFPTVVRTPRGLMISGTRLTLYDIMDYMQQEWSTERIQKWFRLSEQQIIGISEYITTHRAQIEAEYQQVLHDAQNNQQFWMEKNRDMLAKMASLQVGRQEFWVTLHQCQIQRKEE